ncbi:hypothetical protein MTR67_025544 [Solanum verrucosum]|uniref:Uncharacterized protein n=1 Tax=Solanum verrucosum TaxID=315347 RepID=A0AAF0QXC8_SOLVR|nr:hypothetical protein MTR67_025537 [Solanum verrucosum]WMV32159.1 hypothetical protein MTR67_025544 [Solanum verrucosum]
MTALHWGAWENHLRFHLLWDSFVCLHLPTSP